MKFKPFTTILLFLVLILLISNKYLLASGNSPQERYKIVGLSLLPPEGENWNHQIVHPARIEFGKLGNNKLESFIASAVTHKLPESSSEEEFFSKISEERWGEKQVRFKIVIKEEKITHEKGTICVYYHTKYEDHDSEYLANDIPFFIVEDIGLICRHPENSKVGVSIGISQKARPDKLLTSFNKLAENFLNNAEFEPLPDDLI